MFSLFDVPAWFCYQIGQLFIGVARCCGSNAFCSFVCGDALNFSDEIRMKSLQLQLIEVSKLHLKKFGTPLMLSPMMGNAGYSLYAGVSCVVTGTFQDIEKFVLGLLWILY